MNVRVRLKNEKVLKWEGYNERVYSKLKQAEDLAGKYLDRMDSGKELQPHTLYSVAKMLETYMRDLCDSALRKIGEPTK